MIERPVPFLMFPWIMGSVEPVDIFQNFVPLEGQQISPFFLRGQGVNVLTEEVIVPGDGSNGNCGRGGRSNSHCHGRSRSVGASAR